MASPWPALPFTETEAMPGIPTCPSSTGSQHLDSRLGVGVRGQFLWLWLWVYLGNDKRRYRIRLPNSGPFPGE